MIGWLGSLVVAKKTHTAPCMGYPKTVILTTLHREASGVDPKSMHAYIYSPRTRMNIQFI